MSQREHAEHQRSARDEQLEEEPAPTSSVPSSLESDVDAILDEIDSVLEENAEDFVKAFVQKGGQ